MVPIYIDVSDEVTTVIERIKNSTESHLALVVPKGAILIQSIVNLKLIKKSAETAGVEVVLVTTDKIGRNLSTQIGIPSFSKFDPQKMTMSDEDGSSDLNVIGGVKIHRYYDEKEDNLEDAEQPVEPIIIPKEILKDKSGDSKTGDSKNSDSQTSEPLPSESLPEPEKAELKKKQINQDIEMPVKKRVIETEIIKEVIHEKAAEDKSPAPIIEKMASEAVEKVEKVDKADIKENKEVKEVNVTEKIVGGTQDKAGKKKKSFLPATIAYVTIIILIGALGAGYYFLPETNINIAIAGTPWNKDYELTTIQPEITTKEITKEINIKTTGKKEVGDKATGTAKLFFIDSSTPENIPAGAKISAKGLTFVTMEAVTVPGARVENGQIVPGSTTVNITAEQAGADSNLTAVTGTITSPATKAYAQIVSTTGGSTRQIAIISAEDLKNARATTEQQIKDELTNQINDALKDSGYLMDTTKDQFVLSDYNAPAADTEAENFNITAKGTLKRISIDPAKVAVYVNQEAQKENTENTTVAVQDIKSTLENMDTANSTVTVKTTATGITSYKINNLDDISTSISGKTAEEAKVIINDKLQDYKIHEIRIEQKTIGSYLRIPLSKRFVKIQVQDVAL